MPALSSSSFSFPLLWALALGLCLAAGGQAAAQGTARPGKVQGGSDQTEDAPIPYPVDTAAPSRA